MGNQQIPKIVKPPMLPIFGRVLTLFIAMIVSASAACTIWAKGFSWIYDSGSIPLISCPKEIYYIQSAHIVRYRCVELSI
jgi:hypothetical protein